VPPPKTGTKKREDTVQQSHMDVSGEEIQADKKREESNREFPSSLLKAGHRDGRRSDRGDNPGERFRGGKRGEILDRPASRNLRGEGGDSDIRVLEIGKKNRLR